MSEAAPPTQPYTIIGAPIHQDKWVDALNAVVPGWTVRATWRNNKGTIVVFVPDTEPLAATAATMILQQGAQLDALQGIGTAAS
jgi:hypothetical protein